MVQDPRSITLEELRISASSMFVAIFESLCQVRLRSIERVPRGQLDSVKNAKLVLSALQVCWPQVDLRHIDAAKICSGDLTHITNLLEVLSMMYQCMSMWLGGESRSARRRTHTRLPAQCDPKTLTSRGTA